MSGGPDAEALACLRTVPDDAGRMIAKAIEPIDDAIRRIGASLRASHFAEDCRDWDPAAYGVLQAHASRFVFAIEATDGRCSEYSLCAATGPDGRHGLWVSVCEYHVVDAERERKDGAMETIQKAEIDRVYLVRPSTLSLELRALMMDELNQGHFLKAYREHVEAGGPDEAVVRYWFPKKTQET
jgi:hypothetical protein